MEWASSTMRAELARLEELGLLRHPHTSAGRVPTDIRYRYYVDDLLARASCPRSTAPSTSVRCAGRSTRRCG